MKLAIMQPYFFPYLGYWQLIRSVDCFIILDDVDFANRKWINRNRILCNGAEYNLTLPVHRKSQHTKICNASFVNEPSRLQDMMATFRYAYRTAPFGADALALLRQTLPYPEHSVSPYLVNSIRTVCDYLGIQTPLCRSSALRPLHHEKGQDGILALCRLLGADCYINAIGGTSLYNRADFLQNGIRLCFLQTDYPSISRRLAPNHPDYSILHLIANYSKEDLAWMLRQYTLL